MPNLESVTRNFLVASLRELKRHGCQNNEGRRKVQGALTFLDVELMKEFKDLCSFLVANYQIDRKLLALHMRDYTGPRLFAQEFFELYASQLLERYLALHRSWKLRGPSPNLRWIPSSSLNEEGFNLIFEKFSEFMCNETLRVVITAPLINCEYCDVGFHPGTLELTKDLRLRPIVKEDLVDIGGVDYPGFKSGWRSALPLELLQESEVLSTLSPKDLSQLNYCSHVLEIKRVERYADIPKLGLEREMFLRILGILHLINPKASVGIRVISKRAEDPASFLRFPYSNWFTSTHRHLTYPGMFIRGPKYVLDQAASDFILLWKGYQNLDSDTGIQTAIFRYSTALDRHGWDPEPRDSLLDLWLGFESLFGNHSVVPWGVAYCLGVNPADCNSVKEEMSKLAKWRNYVAHGNVKKEDLTNDIVWALKRSYYYLEAVLIVILKAGRNPMSFKNFKRALEHTKKKKGQNWYLDTRHTVLGLNDSP